MYFSYIFKFHGVWLSKLTCNFIAQISSSKFCFKFALFYCHVKKKIPKHRCFYHCCHLRKKYIYQIIFKITKWTRQKFNLTLDEHSWKIFILYSHTKKSQQFTEIKAQNNKVNTAANNQHFLKKNPLWLLSLV